MAKNFEIAFELGAKLDPSVKKAFSKAQENLNNFNQKMGNVVRASGKMAAGVGTAAVGAGAALGGLIGQASSAANEINKFSQVTGMSTKEFQQWDYVAKSFGFSMEQASGDIAMFSERAMDASKGAGEGAELFKELGVSVKNNNGQLKSQEQLFNETITALQGMENTTKRNAMATALLGTTGEELAPVLNMTSKELQNLKGNANVISESDLSKADQFRESWQKAKNTFGSVATEIGIKVMPALQGALSYVTNNMPAIKQTMSSAGDTMARAFQATKPTLQWLGTTGIPLAKNAILQIKETAMNFYNVISNNWGTIKPVLIGIIATLGILKVSMVAMTIFQTVTGFIKAFRAATLAARLTMLGLNGAMLANPAFWLVAAFAAVIAIGIAVWKNWDTVKAHLLIAWNAIKSSVSTVGSAITSAFRGAYQAVTGMFGGLGRWFSGIMSSVTGALASGLNGAIGLANGAINSLNGISVSIPEWVPKFGGQTFGVNIPNIPYLAEGGITTGPTLAMIGEGAEQEAVLPLSKLEGLLNDDGGAGNVYTENEEQSVQIIYSPQYTVPEGASRDKIEQVTKSDYNEFKKFMDRYFREKKRVAFD